ncbi:MAG: methyltransferase domain-containing protein [Phycisphaerales bacterium]
MSTQTRHVEVTSSDPLVSIITPTHNPMYIPSIFENLRKQSYPKWEWVIVPNCGAVVPPINDPRVKIVLNADAAVAAATGGTRGSVGAFKAHAVRASSGSIIVELDHDDFLSLHAIERVVKAFRDGGDFVYSDFAEFHDADGSPHTYHSSFGWKYRDVVGPDGRGYKAASAMPVAPPWILQLTHAPNHIRAWTRKAYDEVGGHNPQLDVSDDFDLMVKFYVAGKKFVHIPECLYFYRMTAQNTHKERNARIQEIVSHLYDHNVYAMMMRWCNEKGLLPIDLGSAHNKPSGYHGVDIYAAPGVDTVANLDGEWPFKDNSVGMIRAWDAIEHFKDPINTFNQAWRVLAPGGMFMIEVPSTDGRGGWQDPTHVAFFNQNSFWYYTRDEFAKFIPAFHGSFYPMKIMTYYPSEFHRANNIPYVRAHLCAIKKGMAGPMPGPAMGAR